MTKANDSVVARWPLFENMKFMRDRVELELETMNEYHVDYTVKWNRKP